MEARMIRDRRQWDEFVTNAELCNVTQSYEWGQLLTMLDSEVLYVGVVDDEGRMCAAMMLLVLRVAMVNAVYFYAPRGPIIADPASPAMTVLLNYVKALAHKYHAFMLKVEPGVLDNDPHWLSTLHRRGFVPNPEALHLRREWVLDVRPDEQTLLANMKEKWRYHIRLAGRKGVTIRRSESPADIDTFYRILQTTSQRDTFIIYDKSFYEKLVELYGQSQNVALFLAEYEGQVLSGVLLVKMGRWCWYMYGASSNEHRNRMPNHLLQWTAVRWAKEQGCWYYNFRGIPDVLEESEPMWGIYVFKRGFGGFDMRSLETHDLPYNPLLYRLYRSWLDGRSWLNERRAKRQAARQLDAAQQGQQGEERLASSEQSKAQPHSERPANVTSPRPPVEKHTQATNAQPQHEAKRSEHSEHIGQEQPGPIQREAHASTHREDAMQQWQAPEPDQTHGEPGHRDFPPERAHYQAQVRAQQNNVPSAAPQTSLQELVELLSQHQKPIAPTSSQTEEATMPAYTDATTVENERDGHSGDEQAEYEEQSEQNEETQKLPRIEIARRYTGTKRPQQQDEA